LALRRAANHSATFGRLRAAFSDGNKRTGFLVAVVFLGLNGFHFEADNAGVVLMIQRLASGHLEWAELEAWFASNSRVKP
jgi:death-on-curing protein